MSGEPVFQAENRKDNVVAACLINYGGLLDIAVDCNLARISGVRVELVNAIFTLISAVTIALSVKIIGALLVSSLIVLPVATALILSRSYKQTYLITIGLGVIYMMAGVVTSYYIDLKPGGAIVINALLGMLIFALIAFCKKRLGGRRKRRVA